MKTMKRLGAMLLAGALAMGTLAGCGGGSNSNSSANSGSASAAASGEALKIGFVNEANTTVFDKLRMDALVEQINEVPDEFSIECSDANNDIQKQIDMANTFIAKGVDCLMLVPCDSEGIVPAVESANQAGIPVICFGIKAAGGEYTYVGSENYEAGQMQGEYMASLLPDNARVLYLAGTAGLQHTADRREGFLDALEEAGRDDVEILEDQDGDYMKDEGMRITEAWIQSYGDGKGGVEFDAIVAANDQMALGAVEALKGANILQGNNEILITGVDGTDEAIEAVGDGYMVQTVLQDAPGQGAAGLEALRELVSSGSMQEEYIVPFVSITEENLADYQ